jgi:riboflavin kinase/FMN adenylyltransferase
LGADIELANQFLGYPFFITGKVIKGDQIGRQIGYPTANIHVEERYKLIPADGIFAVTVEQAGNKYKGMAYIGSRPTINGMTRNIEVNLFDFDKEIYGETIRMNFLHYVRGDIKFNGLDELKTQIAQDKIDVLKLLS